MTSYSFADRVIVPFPFSDGITLKKRPAVVISSNQYQQSRPDVILLAITSRIRNPLGYGEAVIQDWQQAGLMKPSIFKPLVFSLEASRILMKLGTLTYGDRERLAEILQQIIG